MTQRVSDVINLQEVKFSLNEICLWCWLSSNNYIVYWYEVPQYWEAFFVGFAFCDSFFLVLWLQRVLVRWLSLLFKIYMQTCMVTIWAGFLQTVIVVYCVLFNKVFWIWNQNVCSGFLSKTHDLQFIACSPRLCNKKYFIWFFYFFFLFFIFLFTMNIFLKKQIKLLFCFKCAKWKQKHNTGLVFVTKYNWAQYIVWNLRNF